MANPQPEHPWRGSEQSSPFPKLGIWKLAIGNFIHRRLPFLHNLVCFARGGKKKGKPPNSRAGTRCDSLGSVLGFTGKFQEGNPNCFPAIEDLLVVTVAQGMRPDRLWGQRSSKAFPWISAPKTSKAGVTPPFGRTFWE